MERIAVEKSQEKENVDKGKANLNFDDKLFVYFMESYGRVDKIEKEYHKVYLGMKHWYQYKRNTVWAEISSRLVGTSILTNRDTILSQA